MTEIWCTAIDNDTQNAFAKATYKYFRDSTVWIGTHNDYNRIDVKEIEHGNVVPLRGGGNPWHSILAALSQNACNHLKIA